MHRTLYKSYEHESSMKFSGRKLQRPKHLVSFDTE